MQIGIPSEDNVRAGRRDGVPIYVCAKLLCVLLLAPNYVAVPHPNRVHNHYPSFHRSWTESELTTPNHVSVSHSNRMNQNYLNHRSWTESDGTCHQGGASWSGLCSLGRPCPDRPHGRRTNLRPLQTPRSPDFGTKQRIRTLFEPY